MSRDNETSNGTDYPDWIGGLILLLVFLWVVWTWFSGPEITETKSQTIKTQQHHENQSRN